MADPGTEPLVDPAEPVRLPPRAALDQVWPLKYGEPSAQGWAPRLRARFAYHTPDDVYEALVASLVRDGSAWLDVGCGRDLFPSNRPLARRLAARCAVVAGVDPAPTLAENELVGEKVQQTIDEFVSAPRFDLVTLRMVAEHVEHPDRVVAALARCTRPGGLVVIYTVNRFSPVPLLTALVPFALHQPIKRFLWRTEARDTFPTRFRLNTRGRLAAAFGGGGFDEVLFAHLDDCRTLGRFRAGLRVELWARRALRAVGLRYPETCLLGVYRKR